MREPDAGTLCDPPDLVASRIRLARVRRFDEPEPRDAPMQESRSRGRPHDGRLSFFGKQGAVATVLNLVCEEGRERDVAAAMFARLDAEGYAVAVGMAQPFLMNAISRQRWLSFRHRGYFCMVTRHADLKEAAERNDIYIGGLASETWSRLLTDF